MSHMRVGRYGAAITDALSMKMGGMKMDDMKMASAASGDAEGR